MIPMGVRPSPLWAKLVVTAFILIVITLFIISAPTAKPAASTICCSCCPGGAQLGRVGVERPGHALLQP